MVEPSYKLLQDSSPYCIFRNKPRYQHVHALLNSAADVGSMDGLARAQVGLYVNGIGAAPIPSHFLYGTIRRDVVDSVQQAIRNVVAPITHDHIPLFVHIGGRSLDAVNLRDTHHTYNAVHLDAPPGFTLPLGDGAQLRQVEHAGNSHWGLRSHLLVRTSCEVFDVSTLGLDDIRDSGEVSCTNRSYETSPVILAPRRKWQLPTNISDMSSSLSGYSSAAILDTNGGIYTWCPTEGVKSFQSGKSVFNVEPEYRGFVHSRVAGSLHPECYFLSNQQSLYTLDLRAPSSAVSLYTANAVVQSVKPHGRQAHFVLVATPAGAQLVDARFPKVPVAQQHVPGGHELMQFAPTPYADSDAGVFLGASGCAQQIYVHSLEHPQRPVFDGVQRNRGGVDHSTILTGASMAGFQGNVRWDVDGFPVVDAGSPHQVGKGSNTRSNLAGVGLVTLADYDPPDPSDGGDDEGGDDGGGDGDGDRNSAFSQRRETWALLIQQNSRGDAFAQRLRWARNPYLSTPTFLPTRGTQSTSAAQAGGARNSSSGQARRAKRRRPTYFGGDNSEDEESDLESVESTDGHHATTIATAMGRKGAVLHADKKTIQVPAPSLPPPVQVCVPCGVRSWSHPSPGVPQQRREPAWKQIKRFLRTGTRNNGLVLLNALSSQADHPPQTSRQVSSAQPPHIPQDVFPAPAAAFPLFVPEDSMRGFDLLRLCPDDVHAGCPLNLHSTGIKNSSRIPDLGRMQLATQAILKNGPRTLWEINKILRQAHAMDVKVADLRRMLTRDLGYAELLLPFCEAQHRVNNNVGSDQNTTQSRHKSTAQSHEDDEDSEATYASDADSVHRGTNKTAGTGASQSINRPPTFDHMYVQEAPTMGFALEYFRDNSSGTEVRMSRLLPIDATAAAPGCAQIACACTSTDHGATNLAGIAVCDEPTCVTPHRLVYLTTTPSPRAASTTASTSSSHVRGRTVPPTVEPFPWGGLREWRPAATATSSTAHPTTASAGSSSAGASLTSPAAMRTRSQTSTVTSSGPSLTLSQMMFGTQPSQSSTTPAPASQTLSATAAALAQAMGDPTAAAGAIRREDLDVTDNMLAVLNNNWNRAVGNTPWVDPAQFSLLNSWR